MVHIILQGNVDSHKDSQLQKNERKDSLKRMIFLVSRVLRKLSA